MSYILDCEILVSYHEFAVKATRFVRLPFPPFAGLTVRDEGWTFWVKAVEWNIGRGRFVASDEPRTALNEKEFEGIVDGFRKSGWDIFDLGPKVA